MNKNVAGTWNFEMLKTDFDFNDLEEYGFTEDDFKDELDEKIKDEKEVNVTFEFKLEVDCLNEETQNQLQKELNDRGFKVRLLL